MLIGFYVLLFFLGAVFGSFGGVIIERGREGFARADWKRVFGGRSYCPSCKETLTWRQLIPLVGWLIQKGKCFRCTLAIPAWYVREEIIMGITFVVTGYALIGADLTLLADQGVSLQLLFWLLVNWGLILLLIADLLWYELNLYVWIVLMIAVVVFQLGGRIGDIPMMLGGAAVLTLIFYGIYRAAARRQTRQVGEFTEGFGMGDVWMAGLIGALVPVTQLSGGAFFRIQIVLVYLVVSSTLGIIFWGVRKALTGSADGSIPFLPAMIVTFRILSIFHEFFINRIVIL